MELSVDPEVQAVLEFMQTNLPACRLVAIADSLPQLARLLWGRYPQEPCDVITLSVAKPVALLNRSQPNATESGLEQARADGDSAVATGGL